MNRLVFLFISLLFFNCETKTEVDLIVTNANIYTVNDQFDNAEAFVVLDGKFLAVGTSEEIATKYESSNIVDAEGQTITPGFIDAHCHFVGLGLAEQKVRLESTKSYDEVLDRLIAFQKEKKRIFHLLLVEVGIKTIGMLKNFQIKTNLILFFQIHQ